MPKDPEPSHLQRDFTFAAIKSGIRTDGRRLDESRPWDLEWIGGEDGGVECRLGGTCVFARVSSTIVRPKAERPYEGLVSIHFELSPMASTSYETGRSSEEETRLSLLLDKAIRKSDCIDRESLCIIAGEKVLHLRITIHPLSDQGNLLDCAMMAVMAGLRGYRRREWEVEGGEVVVFAPDERPPVALALHHVPLCITFAYFEGLPPILDPSLSELLLSPSLLTLSLSSTSTTHTASAELNMLSKTGGVALSPGDLLDVVRLGGERCASWGAWLEGRVKKEVQARGLEGAL
ncbi:Exosomal 3'-5' exoribonuclease complex, subunit Rrp45 [Phaffia rhodozyma]|uniref:Exosomal 3'-5' exoribonuclease complex, subunit Rrp45 n=1 Tax=Phaffia rhodozyma TaxID=264483 RepID=A0A0F7SL08_PHARH|nr:Exosomal 3'-5' exoribonuclease complex, subunit Rrp45 [Phaffia rhodozyma]